MLIERGADVSAQDKDGQTPLHLALQAGQLEVARMLIERGADVSAQDKDGQTPLHLEWKSFAAEATEESRLHAYRCFDVARCVSSGDKDGKTPLHLASQASEEQVARMAIERGADVSAQDKDGQTPLHLASRMGQLDIARMLIERGADVSAQDKDGQTPIHLASQLGNWKSLACLSSVARMCQPRTRTARLHYIWRQASGATGGSSHMLIERGASVSAQNKDGQTPLHLASKRGTGSHSHAYRAWRGCISPGQGRADVSAQDKDGQTPLHLGVASGATGSHSHASRARRRCSQPRTRTA
jgi:ankyrin repeat protein